MSDKRHAPPGQARPISPRGMPGRGRFVTIEAPQSFRKAIGRLIRHFGGEWPSLIVITLTIVASSATKAIGPALIGGAITDHIERVPNAVAFVRQIAGVLLIYAGGWVSISVSGAFMNRAGNRLVYRLRRDTFAHLQKLSISFFEKRGLGDIISRVTNDIEMIYSALTNGVSNLLGGLV